MKKRKKICILMFLFFFFTACGNEIILLEFDDFIIEKPSTWIKEEEKENNLIAKFYISQKRTNLENMAIMSVKSENDLVVFAENEMNWYENNDLYNFISKEEIISNNEKHKIIFYKFYFQKDIKNPKMLFLQYFLEKENKKFIFLCALNHNSENISQCTDFVQSFRSL